MRYSPVQDRVLLIISTTDGRESRFWMTRRFVTVLWKGLPQVLASYPALAGAVDAEAKEAILAMRHQEAVQDSNFDTPFKGEEPKPDEKKDRDSGLDIPLLTGVKGGVQADGRAAFQFETEGGKPFRFDLQEKLLHAFCHLLIDVTTKAGWDLNMRVGEATVVIPTEGAQVH